MSRYVRMRALGVLMALMVIGALGCSEGEDIPLLAPGGGMEWPIDPGWTPLSPLADNKYFVDGVWNEDASPGEPTVILVGYDGVVMEYTDDSWHSRGQGLNVDFLSVASAGSGKFIAVGDNGVAAWREDGRWQEESSGTGQYLFKVIVDNGIAWAVGWDGAVQRREAGQWTTLPSAGETWLTDVAALHDSVFVTGSDSEIRVWDGQTWGQLADLPWGAVPVKALATLSDGRLYAAADSLYVRGPSGWRSITDAEFSTYASIKMKVSGDVLWFGDNNRWRYVEPMLAAWQPATEVPYLSYILVPRDTETYLTTSSDGIVTWFDQGQASRDPAGDIGDRGDIFLADGGLLFLTDLGVIRRDAESLTIVLDAAQLPALSFQNFRIGCGHSPADYFLAGETSLYHCVNGQAALVGTWAESRDFFSMAIGADNILYASDYDGLWRWQDSTWQRVLPVVPGDREYYKIHTLADGSIGLEDSDHRFYRLKDGQVALLADMRYKAVMQASSDGTVYVVGEHGSTEDFRGGNVLWILDERAGALRNLWDQGMGALVSMSIDGSENHGGESFIWTRNPVMVFALDGPPADAHWRVVAGPLDGYFNRLVRLNDGNLLATSASSGQMFLYRP